MSFWDSSALIPLLLQEPRTTRALTLLEEERAATVWWGSPVECLSAIARREREGAVTREAAEAARAILADLSAT